MDKIDKNTLLCFIRNNDFALHKICGDYILHHLIRGLKKLSLPMLIIGNNNDQYEALTEQLILPHTANNVELLKIVAQHKKTQKVIFLPANTLYCRQHTLKNIISLLDKNHTINAVNGCSRIVGFNTSILEQPQPVNTEVNIRLDNDDFNVINNNKKLIAAENKMQQELRKKTLKNGVILLDANTTYLAYDTKIAAGVVIHPNVFIGTNTVIDSGSTILPFSHIEETQIDKNSIIGPFARIRGKTTIGTRSIIGNFVEVKNSKIADQVKIKHLSYIGDATINGKSNIGAGVVICNYDGKTKYKTTIDNSAFIGANSTLISPLYIAPNVVIGAGSTITDNVSSDNYLAIARAKQVNKIKNN